MPYRTLEASLDSVFIHENGALDEEAAANLLTARLIYPRPGIPTVTTVKTVDLRDGEERVFADAAYSERILFKERIQGRSEIALELSVQLPAARIPGLVRTFLAGAAGAGLAVLGDLTSPLLAGGGSRAAREVTRRGIDGEAEPEPYAVIGAGRTEIDAEELARKGLVVRNLELAVPEPLQLRRTRRELERDPDLSGRFHDHYRATREELRLEAGDRVGWTNLRLSVT